MTYQVLARKWRPKTFNDMAGQNHVLQTLVHALDNNRIHHSYLFTGTRGVGKTTVARIFAKCLNCEEGVSSNPCGKCSSCLEIGEGRFIDLIEVDAASKTKVEDTREMLENVQYAPSRGRYKVYLIDEVHMLSGHSFNALLKTLEEPPPHVVFLLATTDPQKLPITILSRCLKFSLKNLPPKKIVDYLGSVLLAEQVEYEEAALWHLANAAQGSMRDALTLLDQSISFGAGQVKESDVSELLGTPDQALVFKVVEALNSSDASQLLDCVNVITERSFDYFQFLENLISLLYRMALAQLVPGGIDNNQGDREQVIAIAQKFTAEDIQLHYQIALKGQEDLKLSHDPRIAFEMLLLRMLVFSPVTPMTSNSEAAGIAAEQDLGRESEPVLSLEEDEKKKTERVVSTVDISTEPAAPGEAPQLPEVIPEPAALEIDSPPASPAAPDVEVIPERAPIPAVPEQLAPEPEVEREPAPVSDAPHVRLPTELSADSWISMLAAMQVSGITGNLLANCILESYTDDSLVLQLDVDQSALFNDVQSERMGQALSIHLAKPIRLEVKIGPISTESPAQYHVRKRKEHLESLKSDFNADENVVAIVEAFSARIIEESFTVLSEKKS
jgi:DNA polymerase-3 subunit gamma/tau